MKASESRTMARTEWRLWWLRWMNGKNAENINFLAFFVQNFAWNHTISRIVQTNENRCDIIVCELCVILDISIAKRQNLWQSKRNREKKIAEIPLDGVCQSRRYRASIVCFAWAAIWFAEKMPDAGNENDEPINVHKNGYLSENLFICIYGRRRQNTNRLYSLHAFHAIFIFFLSGLSLLVWEWCWSAWGHGIVCTSHNHKMTIKKNILTKEERTARVVFNSLLWFTLRIRICWRFNSETISLFCFLQISLSVQSEFVAEMI